MRPRLSRLSVTIGAEIADPGHGLTGRGPTEAVLTDAAGDAVDGGQVELLRCR
jgi:hypothetical protein